MRSRLKLATMFAATIVTLASLLSGATSATATSSIPLYDHVVLAIFENHKQSQIIGSPNAPYLTNLSTQGANFTQSFAIEHPSEPNYLDLFSGSNQGVTDDSCPHTFGTDNLGHQLIASGKTFTAYSEDLPSVGSLTCTSGLYARKHNPWTNFSDLNQNTVNLPFTSFPTDFTTLPTHSWIVPNLCDDMHDCSVPTGDTWAQNHLDAYAQWAKTHNSLLIVTFDEDDSTGGNQVATLFVGAHINAGNYSEHIDHFTVLRTIDDMYGVSALGSAASRAAITDVFNTGTANTVTVTNPGNQTSTVGTAISPLQIQASDSAPGQTLTYSTAGLPAGLLINSATGLISGTPTTAATSSVTITATDTTNASGSAAFTWTVNPSGSGTLVSGGVYEIGRIGTSQLIDYSSRSAGSQLIVAAATHRSDQRWTATTSTNGSYALKNVKSGLCMDVSGTSVGAAIIHSGCNGTTSQNWTLTASGSGYALVSQLSGLSVTPSGTANGSTLSQQSGTSAAWAFSRVA